MAESKKSEATKPVGIINLLSTNKEQLVSAINQIIENDPDYNPKDGYLVVQRGDCGCRFKFMKAEDVPDKDLVCKHGHTVIKYTDLTPDEI